MRPKQGLQSCQKHVQALREKTRLHSTRPRNTGYSRLRQQKSRRKESLWWIPELVCIWSASETLTLLSWRPWGHRGVRRRWWRPTARCKQEKTPRYMSKKLDLFITVMLLEETPAHGYASGYASWRNSRSSLGKLCEDHEPVVKNPHLAKNGKNIDCKKSSYLPFVVPRLSTSSSTTPTLAWSSSVGLCSGFPRSSSQKPKTTIKMKDAKKYRAIYYVTCLIGCMSSERIRSMNLILQSHGETLSLDIETLPVLLMNYQWSREQKWNRVRVSIVSTRTFRRTQIAISLERRK